MGGSIRMFSVRGIAVKMHLTFPLILIWAGFQFGLIYPQHLRGALFGVFVTLLLFGIVLLHEFGHSFVAMHFGVRIREIVLLPIGGVAQMSRMPDKPSEELAIAAAGPAVNLVLGAILGLMAMALAIPLDMRGLIRSLAGLGGLSIGSAYTYLFVTNLFIAAFNLVPAFPMDGGRVLRGLLAIFISYERATTVAVLIGQGMAFLMGLAGFLQGNLFLILIAVFVFFGASQEGRAAEVRRVLGGVTVGQVYTRQAHTLAPGDSLYRAVELTLNTFQSDFPVCEGDRYLGMVTHRDLVDHLETWGGETAAGEVMHKELPVLRPVDGIFEAQMKLSGAQQDSLPVVEAGRFLGLLTVQDVNRAYQLLAGPSQRNAWRRRGF